MPSEESSKSDAVIKTTRLERSNPTREDRKAHAPYNFIPLPAKNVKIDPPPYHDKYDSNLLTGQIKLKITTKSPTYIRGMLSPDEFDDIQKLSREDQQKDVQLKERLAKFYSTSDQDIHGKPAPTIPGSSLRGMLRSLVEIISYSRIHNVAADPEIWFREIASGKSMSGKYKEIVSSRNIRAGFIRHDSGNWYVEPADIAQNPFFSTSFFLVKNDTINRCIKNLPGFIQMYEDDYKIGVKYEVWFRATRGRPITDREGRPRIMPVNIVDEVSHQRRNGLYLHGWIVTTGKMGSTAKNPRRKYLPVVLYKQKIDRGSWKRINPGAIAVYIKGLSDLQMDDMGSSGCLKDGQVVFYIPPGPNETEVRYFGHNPWPRIPMYKDSSTDVITPLDLVPDQNEGIDGFDFSDAIFGPELGHGTDENAYAGRVSFRDANLDKENKPDNIWYKTPPEPQPLKILGSPKPTAYALYLVHDRLKGHDPDFTRSLANYGTSISETEINGNKGYPPQGEDPNFIQNKENDFKEEHHTRVIALNKDVVFNTLINFQNLRPEELGSLLWAIELDGEAVHRIGMGKPYGMGSIKVECTELIISNRIDRYKSLFTNDGENIKWNQPVEQNVTKQNFIDAFETHILTELGKIGSDFSSLDRIHTLLLMLRWKPILNDSWKAELSYQELGEFKFDRVLPTFDSINNNHKGIANV